MSVLDWLRGGHSDPLDTDPARLRAAALYAALLTEAGDSRGYADPRTLATGRQILAETPEVQGALLEVACDAIGAHSRGKGDGWSQHLTHAVVQFVLKRKVIVPPARVVALLDICTSVGSGYSHWLPVRSLLRFVATPPSSAESEALRRLRTVMRGWNYREAQRTAERIDLILGGETRALKPGGPWSARVLADVDVMPLLQREAWRGVLTHLFDAGERTPSRKWEKELQRHLDGLGRSAFLERSLEWLALGPLPGETPEPRVPERDANCLAGLVWALASFDNVSVARTLADLSERCFKKVPNLGPVSARVGNACIVALARLSGTEPLAQLGRLRTRVKYVVGRRLVERALAEAAVRKGLTLDELEEIAVPTFDLDAGGALTRCLGVDTAEIRIVGSDDVVLSWTTLSGRGSKGVPASVRRSHAGELARLKKTVKEIAAFLPSQRTRLEQLLTADRVIPFDNWRARYVEHPLVGHMARRLIWRFGDGEHATLAALHDGKLLDVEGRSIGALPGNTSVRLWHPLGHTPQLVLAWRQWLDRHGVVQPFKQAHREIYLLTDAELATETYSNRFAAHVIRQHQFAALCRERDWRYTLQGVWDSANSPSHRLQRWNLDVQFLVEGPTDGSGVLDSGIFQFVLTDQVRFCRDGEVVPLVDVPALAFSEAMRDVDLFVGVCSVGNDPTWGDRGPAPFGAYWQTFSFGDLSESARTRRAVLEGIIPRLAIAARLTLDDRFLVVRGDLATYRVHLGSTNVLIEPGSRYLCIVPGPETKRPRGPGIRLPFEGDRGLAIILSKALLLSKDTAIIDPTIVSQILA